MYYWNKEYIYNYFVINVYDSIYYNVFFQYINSLAKSEDGVGVKSEEGVYIICLILL